MVRQLAEQKHFAYRANVSLINDGYVGQVTFLFLCFLGQNVTLESVLTLDFTGSGKSKSFFSTELVFTFGIFLK